MLDNRIDVRVKRSWEFFRRNAGELILGGLVVAVGWMVVIPGPWFTLNLLQEALECVRSGRQVRWQATYQRSGNFFRSWGLTLAMGIPLLIGFALLIVPGVLLSLYWLHAPVLVADGRPVIAALRESGRIFQRRKDWAAWLLNWLVLAILWSLGGSVVFALVLTVPLSLVFLVLCFTDEVGTPTVEHVPPLETPA